MTWVFPMPGCYGGEIDTPNLNALAAEGLRFTQHYSAGRCWPSRACILTGYYAQHIRRDTIADIRKNETDDRPAWAPLLPELLKPAGYRCYHSGKWHIDGEPTSNGFDRSWGRHKLGCDWDRYFDSKNWKEDGLSAPVEPGQQYYSTVAIADHAIACLDLHRRNCPDAPFFQYVAFYSPHFPLHALQKDIDRYRKTYLQGWDCCAPEPFETDETNGHRQLCSVRTRYGRYPHLEFQTRKAGRANRARRGAQGGCLG